MSLFNFPMPGFVRADTTDKSAFPKASDVVPDVSLIDFQFI
jgi:hypothetical protein